jgi:hypothetical protein
MQNQKKFPVTTKINTESEQDTLINDELENEKFICRLEIQRKLLMNFIDMANSNHTIQKDKNNVDQHH